MELRKVLLRILAVTATAAVLAATGCVLSDEGGFPAGLPIERVSVSASGTEGDGYSNNPSLSADGRYVAFESSASNLVSGDTSGAYDIFVYDRQTGGIERVSVDGSGAQGDFNSTAPSLSADGRYVAFESAASNLVAGDTNGESDVFVYDRQTNSIERVSVDGSGAQANGGSYSSSISADGRYVAFKSLATNLVSGDTNICYDIFVYDRQLDGIERVSVDGSGTQGDGHSENPSISADGRYVAFHSNSSNLVAGDTNGTYDIFVYDRQADSIERVSLDGSGAQVNGSSYSASISADGSCVAFESDATNLVAVDTNSSTDIFVYDRLSDSIERVSIDGSGTQGDDASYSPSISADGRYVAFYSESTNLVGSDTNAKGDVFVYDRQADTIQRVSVDSSGAQGNEGSYTPSISVDGRYVAFMSIATNLVTGDTNARWDIFAAPVP
jgi:Tol biopolymer transport system component